MASDGPLLLRRAAFKMSYRAFPWSHFCGDTKQGGCIKIVGGSSSASRRAQQTSCGCSSLVHKGWAEHIKLQGDRTALRSYYCKS
jgi:hypothetical protein